MSKELKKHLLTISQHFPELRRSYNVKKIGIFGSVARGDTHKNSDLDVLVDFDKSISLFDLVDLEDYLQKVLRRKVDVVPRRAIKPLLRKNILRDVAYATKAY